MQKYLLSAQNVSRLIFASILAFTVLFWYLGFDGLYFYDDYSYSLYASQLTSGGFSPGEDIFSHRFLVFIPVAVLYDLFGINDLTTTLWPLAVTLAATALAFVLLKPRPMLAAAAVVLLGLNFYPIFFSNKLYPDSIVSFFCFLSVCILFRMEERNYLVRAAAFVLSVFCAFISKETVVYFFPFYMILFISDMLSGENKKFWLATGFITVLVFSGYFICYKIQTGSYFFRFDVIENGRYAFPLSYFQKPFTALIPRLTYEPLFMMLSSEMIIPFIFSIPLMLNFRLDHLRKLRTDNVFWSTLVISLLLMIWFGSTSFKEYNPVSLQPRMFILLIPPLAVLASFSIEEFISKKSGLLLVSGLFLIASVMAFYLNMMAWVIYLFLGLILILLFLTRRKLDREKLIPVLIFSVMAITALHPLYIMYKPDQTGYFSEKKIIDKYLKGEQGSNLVVAEGKLCSGYLYYYQFKANSHYRFLNYKQLAASDLKADRYFVLINKFSFDLFHQMGDPYPKCYNEMPSGWKLVSQDGNVKLYEAPSPEDLKAGF